MSFVHDSTGIDPSGFALLPDKSWHTLEIVAAIEMQSRNGNDMIECICAPIDPQYDGVKIWHYVVFLPKDQKGAGISVHFRKCIGEPYGGNNVVDANNWVGKQFRAYVAIDEYEGKKRNKIVNVEPTDESPLPIDDNPFA